MRCRLLALSVVSLRPRIWSAISTYRTSDSNQARFMGTRPFSKIESWRILLLPWARARAGSERPAFWPVQLSPGLQQQVAQPDRSGIELCPRRVKHELLVDAWIERRPDFPQRP